MMFYVDFIWNEKTGELERAGKLIALGPEHAIIFAGYLRHINDGPIASRAFAEEIGLAHWIIEKNLRELRYLLAPLGIRIVTKRGGKSGGKNGGRFLVFGDVPKWAPKIPETTAECTLRESELVPRH